MTASNVPDLTRNGGASRLRFLRSLEPFLWLALVIFLLIRFGPQLSAWTGIGSPGGEAPALELVMLDGTRVGPEDTEGRVHVVTFWATWCRVCRVELPALQRLHEEWDESGEVVVVGLSIDTGGADVVRAHVSEAGYAFPVSIVDRRTQALFGGVPGVPTTIVIDREGQIRHTMVGLSGPGTLRRAVRRLLDEGD